MKIVLFAFLFTFFQSVYGDSCQVDVYFSKSKIDSDRLVQKYGPLPWKKEGFLRGFEQSVAWEEPDVLVLDPQTPLVFGLGSASFLSLVYSPENCQCRYTLPTGLLLGSRSSMNGESEVRDFAFQNILDRWGAPVMILPWTRVECE